MYERLKTAMSYVSDSKIDSIVTEAGDEEVERIIRNRVREVVTRDEFRAALNARVDATLTE